MMENKDKKTPNMDTFYKENSSHILATLSHTDPVYTFASEQFQVNLMLCEMFSLETFSSMCASEDTGKRLKMVII